MATLAHVGPASRRGARSRRTVDEPRYIAGVLLALARGAWYRFKFRLTGIRFRAGRNLRVYGRLDVRGPGTVTFGDDSLVFDQCHLITHDRDARLDIGSGVQMRSTHFDCAREVLVGENCLLAMAYIADTDSHSTHVNRHSPDAMVHVAPVRIDENVWVAQFAGVLPGAHVGRNSVVSCGSVCNRVYPPNSILVGNPARVVGVVPGGEQSTLPRAVV